MKALLKALTSIESSNDQEQSTEVNGIQETTEDELLEESKIRIQMIFQLTECI